MRGFARLLLAAGISLAVATPAAADICYQCWDYEAYKPTYRVSLTDTDQEANGPSGYKQPNGHYDVPSVSADGRYTVFTSYTALMPQDQNSWADVYVRDRQNGTTALVSVTAYGNAGSGESSWGDISPNGRYVAFMSTAADVIQGGYPTPCGSVYLRDLQLGTTVKVADGGASPQVSSDGRYVSFITTAAMVPSDTNGWADVYLRDLQTQAIERVSVPFPGAPSDDPSGIYFGDLSMSADARYVTFATESESMVSGDSNNKRDVFLRDRQTATTVRVSVGPASAQANGNSYNPSISDDGKRIAFNSNATNLTAQADGNGDKSDVFVRDLQAQTTTLASKSTGGQWGNAMSQQASISANGAKVAFVSWSSNLVTTNNYNGYADVYVRNLGTDTTSRASVSGGGAEANSTAWYPAITPDGSRVAFVSSATNLVSGDTNAAFDVFLKTL